MADPSGHPRRWAQAVAQLSEPRRFPLLIGGHRVATDEWFPVTDPRDDQALGAIAWADATHVAQATAAASRAFQTWRTTSPLERGAALRRYALRLDEHAAELAELVSREVGKPLVEAQLEVARAIEVVHHFAGEASHLVATHLPGERFTTGSTVRPEPVGVVASITPWNFPVALVLWKLAPALAAGCSVVVKPAQEAPLAAWRLGELALDVGFPDGTVNVVTGDGPLVGEALATDPLVAKIAFTGSRRVATQLAAWTAPRLIPMTLELGGHGALVVLDDADLDVAVDVAIVQGYVNTGQACYSVNRVILTDATYEPFLERFRERFATLPPGVMTTDRGRRRHAELLEDAQTRGADVVGGQIVDDRVVSPAYVTGAGQGVRVVDEEPFTPIVTLMRMADLDSAIAEANRPQLGLVHYVCGGRLGECLEVATRLQSGTVVINGWRVVVPHAPYGGWQASGVGTELGRAGLEAFCRWQHLRVLA